MIDSEQGERSHLVLRNKANKFLERLGINLSEKRVIKEMSEIANQIRPCLNGSDGLDRTDKLNISGKNLNKIAVLRGPQLTSLTTQEKKTEVDWDSYRLRYFINESNIPEGAYGVMVLPTQFGCTNPEVEAEAKKILESREGESDESLMDVVLSDIPEKFDRREWHPKETYAHVFARVNDNLLEGLVYPDEEGYNNFFFVDRRSIFKNGRAEVGVWDFLTGRDAEEVQRANEKYGQVVIWK